MEKIPYLIFAYALLVIVLLPALLFLGFAGFTWSVTTLFGLSIPWTFWNFLAYIVLMMTTVGSYFMKFNRNKDNE